MSISKVAIFTLGLLAIGGRLLAQTSAGENRWQSAVGVRNDADTPPPSKEEIIKITMSTRHEYGLYVGGGVSTLLYKPVAGDPSLGPGGLAGLNYKYHLNEHFSVIGGAEFAFYSSRVSIGNFLFAYSTEDEMEGKYEFISQLVSYQESQHLGMLQIPIMVQMQYPRYRLNYRRNNAKFAYFNFGGKIGIPLFSGYSSSGTLKTSGYFELENYEYTDIPGVFGSYPTKNVREPLFVAGLSMLLSVECGILWIRSTGNIYAGVYMDYGISPSLPSKPFVREQSEAGMITGSVLGSQYVSGQSFTDDVAPLAFGLKVGWRFIVKAVSKQQPVMPTSLYRQQAASQKAPQSKEDIDEQRRYRMAVSKVQQSLGGNQYFTELETDLSKATEKKLDEKIEILKEFPTMNIIIEGHTCNILSHKANVEVGQRRADIVKSYMVEKGIAERRIKTVSKAEAEPIELNNNEKDRKVNRRIKIIVDQ
ncbi:MAG: OmpA family protein [Prevotellaceae bacterium]|jgi:outer membrane protein OmpA-like peptidoglycan-associated protein|nr:OmpA family protein [Prevotellaceae bacterium]